MGTRTLSREFGRETVALNFLLPHGKHYVEILPDAPLYDRVANLVVPITDTGLSMSQSSRRLFFLIRLQINPNCIQVPAGLAMKPNDLAAGRRKREIGPLFYTIWSVSLPIAQKGERANKNRSPFIEFPIMSMNRG